MCWRVLSDCQTPSPASCNLVRLYGNLFNLNYTFTSVGTYCLDLSVRNNISNLQTSYDIYVQSSRKSSTILYNNFFINWKLSLKFCYNCSHPYVIPYLCDLWNTKWFSIMSKLFLCIQWKLMRTRDILSSLSNIMMTEFFILGELSLLTHGKLSHVNEHDHQFVMYQDTVSDHIWRTTAWSPAYAFRPLIVHSWFIHLQHSLLPNITQYYSTMTFMFSRKLYDLKTCWKLKW